MPLCHITSLYIFSQFLAILCCSIVLSLLIPTVHDFNTHSLIVRVTTFKDLVWEIPHSSTVRIHQYIHDKYIRKCYRRACILSDRLYLFGYILKRYGWYFFFYHSCIYFHNTCGYYNFDSCQHVS